MTLSSITSLTTPLAPDVPDAQRARVNEPVRYEDICQDGRLLAYVLPHFAARAVWQDVLAKNPAARAAGQLGIMPILSRFDIEATDATISVRKPLTVEGRYQLAHSVDASGAVNRIVLGMWAEVSGPRGRTHGPPPPGAGEIVPIGRVFAEHVFTRLFAPPGERKVLRLDIPSMPDFSPVPPARHEWRSPDEILALPAGAKPLGDLAADDFPTVFGLLHTDSNQHVNSLVYPRLFEEAAIRRFVAIGRSASVLARTIEIAYRKPCFAGERMSIQIQPFEKDGQLGALGSFVPAGSENARPNCVVRMLFS